MTDKKKSPAYNAKILTTSIALTSAFGIQAAYAISSNIATATAQIAQTEVAPNLEPNLVLPAPTQPGPATPLKQKKNTTTQNVVSVDANGVSTVVPDTLAPVVQPEPVIPAPVPTTAPATSGSK